MNGVIAALVLAISIVQSDSDYIVKGGTGAINTCGPDSLYVVLKMLGYDPDLLRLRQGVGNRGIDLLSLKKLANEYGIEAIPIKAESDIPKITPPFILHGKSEKDEHYIVVLARNGMGERWLVYDNMRGVAWLRGETVSRKYRPDGVALCFNLTGIRQVLGKNTALEEAKRVFIYLCAALGVMYVLAAGVRRYGSYRKKVLR